MSASNRTGIGPDSGLEPDLEENNFLKGTLVFRETEGVVKFLIEDLGVSLVRRKGDGKALEEKYIFLGSSCIPGNGVSLILEENYIS